MRKLCAMICFMVFIGIGLGCGKNPQNQLNEGDDVDYLFDPASKTCAVMIRPDGSRAAAWQVPCTPAVVKKLSPSVRGEAEAAFKEPPPECPR